MTKTTKDQNSTSWTVDRDTMLAAATAMSLVPPQPGVPSSDFYKVDRKKSRAQFTVAGVVTGITEIKGQGEWPFEQFFLDRRTFIPFVQAGKDIKSKAPFEFTGKTVTNVSKKGVKTKNRYLIVRQGKRKAVFDAQPEVPGYGFPPSVTQTEGITIDDTTREMIYCARECSHNDPVTPHLSCVYVRPDGKETHIYATDKKIVYRATAKHKLRSAGPIPFPLFLVSLLGEKSLQSIHWKDKIVSLDFGVGQVWQPVSVKALKNFPARDIDKALSKAKTAELLFTGECKALATVYLRLGTYLGLVRRSDMVLSLSADKGDNEVRLECNIPSSAFKERLHLDKPVKQSFKMDWPFGTLLPVFAFLNNEKKSELQVRLDEKAGICYLLLPHIQIGISTKQE